VIIGPIIVADYGSSQGKNSLAPMSVAVEILRRRVGRERPIFVFHIDLPSNDFNSLFEVTDSDAGSYVVDEPLVFPCAIGRSFYRSVLPPSSVDVGWSSFAAQWLSTIPAYIPGHIAFFRSEGEVLAAFNRQAAQDWEAFLTLRGRELRPGGRLVILQPARDENGRTGFEELGDHTNNALAEMVEERLITPDEHARMVLGGYVRRKCELLAPFRTNGSYQNLYVESCELIEVPDPAWTDCVQDGKSESWAARHALVFRTAFAPSLATALAGTPDDERHGRFGDQLEERLKRRLAARPAPVNMLVTAMVLAKEEANFDE
jgi:SAM dependent carboxyl methyltransferase